MELGCQGSDLAYGKSFVSYSALEENRLYRYLPVDHKLIILEFQLHREFEASMGYMSFCLNKQTEKTRHKI